MWYLLHWEFGLRRRQSEIRSIVSRKQICLKLDFSCFRASSEYYAARYPTYKRNNFSMGGCVGDVRYQVNESLMELISICHLLSLLWIYSACIQEYCCCSVLRNCYRLHKRSDQHRQLILQRSAFRLKQSADKNR